jgi:hypothetical protein
MFNLIGSLMDFAAIVSATGGSLGLFLGFSFYAGAVDLMTRAGKSWSTMYMHYNQNWFWANKIEYINRTTNVKAEMQKKLYTLFALNVTGKNKS